MSNINKPNNNVIISASHRNSVSRKKKHRPHVNRGINTRQLFSFLAWWMTRMKQLLFVYVKIGNFFCLINRIYWICRRRILFQVPFFCVAFLLICMSCFVLVYAVHYITIDRVGWYFWFLLLLFNNEINDCNAHHRTRINGYVVDRWWVMPFERWKWCALTH